jgi:hypothetical protein
MPGRSDSGMEYGIRVYPGDLTAYPAALGKMMGGGESIVKKGNLDLRG